MASHTPDKPPLYKSWQLWTAIGVVAGVAIGVGVGVGVGCQQRSACLEGPPAWGGPPIDARGYTLFQLSLSGRLQR
jgi:hypothetical protein